MANLFDINARLYALLENGYDETCINLETGEFDAERAARLLDEVQVERIEKIDGIALYIEKLGADAEALKKKCDTLTARRRAAEAKAERLKEYLGAALSYEKYESDNVKISYRKSQSVSVNEALLPDAYFAEKITRSADKEMIKNALKRGEQIPGAILVEKRSVQIK